MYFFIWKTRIDHGASIICAPPNDKTSREKNSQIPYFYGPVTEICVAVNKMTWLNRATKYYYQMIIIIFFLGYSIQYNAWFVNNISNGISTQLLYHLSWDHITCLYTLVIIWVRCFLGSQKDAFNFSFSQHWKLQVWLKTWMSEYTEKKMMNEYDYIGESQERSL